MSTADEQIVGWAVAAFMSSPDASHDELVAQLRKLGVPHASRACALLPIAFGRRILERLVELPPAPNDPLYTVAAAFARDAGRDQVKVIGLRSAEVNAVNQALHAGSKAENLMLSPPVFADFPDEPGDLPDAQRMLDELLTAHAPGLAWKASVWPKSLQQGHAQLVFEVCAPCGDRSMLETFAGTGSDVAKATVEALDKFARGSLHVLLATLVDRGHGGEQVEWERCGAREVCIGPLLTLWSPPPPALDYGKLLDALLARLGAEPLTVEPHWVRVFAAHRAGELFGNEVLLDNKPWPAGEAVVRAHRWPDSETAYAVRHFLALP